jgi:hypothetical protein
LSVRRVLGFLVGFCLGAHVQEFGPVKADTVGPPFQAMTNLVRKLNIAVELYACAIRRFGREVSETFQPRRHRAALFVLAAIASDGLFVRA